MRYIGFDREDAAEMWARKKLGLVNPPEFFRAMSAVDADGQFVCVVVLTNFSMYNIDVNIAMETKKMRPKETVNMFNAVFTFIFEQLNMRRATGLTGGNKVKARKAIEQFGFKQEGVMRKALKDGEDLVVYGILADEYKNHNWYRPCL